MGGVHAVERREFDQYRVCVREQIDAALARWLERHASRASPCGRDVELATEAVRSLSLRGGKRVRPALMAAAYEAYGGKNSETIALAGVALELLQTYLLIHDDWMDQDDVRRGGPSTHALLAGEYGHTRAGEVGAVLAGDWAMGLAQEALAEVPVRAECIVDAFSEFARIQSDAVLGQLMDVRGAATTSESVETMHTLKTASYTVRGPMVMGAALAGASRADREGIVHFAVPLGIAFQLRDDLLGTFGDPADTGKPIGNDLRQGKHTALVVDAGKSTHGEAILARVLGVADASDEEVRAATEYLRQSGAKDRIEARIQALLSESARVLQTLPIADRGRTLFRGALVALTQREQ